MSINVLDEDVDGEDAMARASKSKRSLNMAAIEQYVSRFRAAGSDQDAFQLAFDELHDDASLAAAEIIAIANAYAIAGVKATSKASALKRLKKRFTEVVRTKGNVRIAEKVRPW